MHCQLCIAIGATHCNWQVGLSLIYMVILSTIIECDVQFQYDSEQCLNQPVEYQCTVTGSGTNILTWRVYNADGTQFGSSHTYLSIYIGSSVSIGGVFTVEQLSLSPLISNISFTVQSNINGYTIICEDGITLDNSTLKLDINADPVEVLGYTDFTNSSVNISWTESSSPCVTGYRYNISSSAPGWDNISLTTSSAMSFSAIVDGLIISTDPYHVIVTVNEKYTSRDSEESCFYFNVPPPVVIDQYVINSVPDTNTDMITITWTRGTYNEEECVIDPVLLFHVSTMDNSDGSVIYQSTTTSSTSYTFTATEGHNYTIDITAENNIGNSSTTSHVVVVPIGSSSTTQPTSATSSTDSNTINTDNPTTETTSGGGTNTSEPTESPPTSEGFTGLGTPAIVGIVAGVIILILVVTVIVLVVVFCVCCKEDHGSVSDPIQEKPSSSRAQLISMKERSSNRNNLQRDRSSSKMKGNKAYGQVRHTPTTVTTQDYEIPIRTNEVEMKSNTAYGQVKYTTDNPTTSGAVYEPMYM